MERWRVSLLLGAVSLIVLASVALLSQDHPSSQNSPDTLLSWDGDASAGVGMRAQRVKTLSSAHRQMLAAALPNRARLFTMLGCECQDISKVWTGANIWGNYTPKCCSHQSAKTSVSSVLDNQLKMGVDDLSKIKTALAKAKANLHKSLSIVVDAVTLKNAGRPGIQGRRGKRGPQGYPGPPGPQGPRGPPGAVGPTGPMGHQGQKGYRGQTGKRGPKGPEGFEGVPGPPGYIGNIGPRGPPGAMGPPGPKGPVGAPGNEGMIGPPGERGPIGGAGPDGVVTPVWGYKGETNCANVWDHYVKDLDQFGLMDCNRWGTEFLTQFGMSTNWGNQLCKDLPWHYGRYRYQCSSAARWAVCGNDGETCNCNGRVRFGYGTYWSDAKAVTGSIACNAQNFGDPIVGTSKHCECANQDQINSRIQSCSTEYSSWQYAYQVAYMDRQNVYCPSGKLISSLQAERSGDMLRYKMRCCFAPRSINNCRTVYSGCNEFGGNLAQYLDRHNIQCNPTSEALQSFKVVQNCGAGNQRMQFEYSCCGY